MTEVARLTYAVDATQVTAASQALQRHTQTATGAAQASQRYQQATGRAAVASRQAATAQTAAARATGVATTAANRGTKAMGAYAGAMGAVKTQAAAMISPMTALQGLFAGLVGGAAIRSLQNTAMMMQRAQMTLTFVTGSAAEAREEFDRVAAVADRLGLSIEGVLPSFTSYAAAARTLDVPMDSIRTTFEGVSAAMLAMGRNEQDAQRALTALQQILSKGKVQAEELTQQFAEALPGGVALAAEAMGYTGPKAIERFREAMEDGELSAKVFVENVGRLLKDRFADQIAEVDTATKKMGELENAFFSFKRQIIDAGFMDALVGTLEGLTTALNSSAASALASGIGTALNVIADVLPYATKAAIAFTAALAVSKIQAIGASVLAIAPYINTVEKALFAAGAAASKFRVALARIPGLLIAVGATEAIWRLMKGFDSLEDRTGRIDDSIRDGIWKGVEGITARLEKATAEARRLNAETERGARAEMARRQTEYENLQHNVRQQEARILASKNALLDRATSSDPKDAGAQSTRTLMERMRREGRAKRGEEPGLAPTLMQSPSEIAKAEQQLARTRTKLQETGDALGEVRAAWNAYQGTLVETGGATTIANKDMTDLQKAMRDTAKEAGKARDEGLAKMRQGVAELEASMVPAIARTRQYQADLQLLRNALDAGQISASRHAELRNMRSNQYTMDTRGEGAPQDEDMWSASERAMKDYAREAQDTAGAVGSAWESGMQRAEDSMVQMFKTGKIEAGSFFEFIGDQLLRMALRQAVLGPAAQWIGNIFGMIGGSGFESFGASPGSVNPTAAGLPSLDLSTPASMQPMSFSSKGNVFTGPSVTSVSEYGNEEAVVPLKRMKDGNLGVTMAGGGGGGASIFAPKINITVEGGSGGSPEAREDQAQRTSRALQRTLENQQAEFLQKQMRSGGMLRPVGSVS